MLARSGMFVLLVAASAALAGPSELPAPLPPLPPNAPLPLAPALAAPLAPVAPGDDHTAKPVVLEEFTIAKNGDAILVPVTVAGKTRMFLLDTGFTYSAIDLPVLKGSPFETVALTAAEGSNVAVPIFHPPEASVGRLGFRGVSKVIGMDMAPVREASGHPIEGILGMDFLFRHVIQLDFDAGKLRFLQTADPRHGAAVPISWAPGGRPQIRAVLAHSETVDFVLDTGLISGDELGAIEPKLHQSLLQKSRLRALGYAQTVTAAGTNLTAIGEVDQFKLADIRVDKPVFHVGLSLLGLGFLSRFNVTLDFPNNSMYLRARTNRVAGKRYVLSGIGLGSLQGKVVVRHVSPGGRQEKLGLNVNDVIQQVDQKNVGPSDLFDLRQRLNEEGQVSLVIERGKTEHTFKLTLVPPNDSPESQPVLTK